MIADYIQSRFHGQNFGDIEEKSDGFKLIKFVDIYVSKITDEYFLDHITPAMVESIKPFHNVLISYGFPFPKDLVTLKIFPEKERSLLSDDDDEKKDKETIFYQMLWSTILKAVEKSTK